MNWLEVLGVIFLVIMGLGVVGYVVFWAKELLDVERDILASVQGEEQEDEESEDEEAKEGGGV